VPFVTGWMGENHFAKTPTAVYGVVLLMAGAAYFILERTIIRSQGEGSLLARAVGGDVKGRASMAMYAAAIPLAFVEPWLAYGIYAAVALMWLLPDRRIERIVTAQRAQQVEHVQQAREERVPE
jgi:uncharacterized membrane protein